MDCSYNLRSPAVKRILQEAKEMEQKNSDLYYARPLEDNIFEWHFTVRGADDTEFANGFYHGRIILPNEYPMKPPSIILLTPNGRFQLNKKICLSISGHHPETWMPSWSIRTVLLAIISFMPTPANGHLGALDYDSDTRRLLAQRSHKWKCNRCGLIIKHFKINTNENNNETIRNTETEMQQNMSNTITSEQAVVDQAITAESIKDQSSSLSVSPNSDNNNNRQSSSEFSTLSSSSSSPSSMWSSLTIFNTIYYSIFMLIIGLLLRRLLTHI